MYKYGTRWLRIVLSFVLAVAFVALLLSLLAGPARIVHALAGATQEKGPRSAQNEVAPLGRGAKEAAGGQVQPAGVDPPPPEPARRAAPRPPLDSELKFALAPQELHVCSSGCPYTTVQGAVDAARPGDVILVAEGTYGDHDGDGYVVEVAKTVTLRGGYAPTDWTTPDIDAQPTVLDGQNTARVILVSGDVAPRIEGFVIRNGATEVGGNGGGVYVAGGEPILARCRIENNTASFSGGGLYIAGGAPLIENCLLVENQAAQKRGGGVYVADGFATLRYSVFYQNAALQQGGGMYVAGGSATVRGVIFAANTAAAGGGVYVDQGSLFFSYNGYWNNSPTHVAGSLALGGSDLVDVDPLFVDPEGGDWHLGAGSPYVDAGDTGSYPAVDYEGKGRYAGMGPDIGAYERYEGTCFARAGERPIRGSVNAALADAAAGDVVKVAGVCTGTGESVVTLERAVTLRGGYTLTNWTDPDGDRYPSVIDGEGARRGISVGTVAAVIEGLRIRNGYHDVRGAGVYIGGGSATTVRDNEIASNMLLPPDGTGGGGIFIANGDGVSILNNDIHHNEIFVAATHSSSGGAGIFVLSGSPLIEGNEVHDNTVHGFGGAGIYIYNGGSIVRRNHIYNNSQLEGNNGGAGVYVFGGTALVERNDIHDNVTASTFVPSGGGGIYVHLASTTIRNNLIYSNTAARSGSGGGLFVYSAVPTINGNTFYQNEATTGGAAFLNGTATVVRNSIIATNTAGAASGVYGNCDYCLIWGNTNSNGSNTNPQLADPQFVDPDAADFHLQASSAAIDHAGPSYPQMDYEGYARPFGAAADIGAFEFYAGDCFARVGSGAVYPTVQQAIGAAAAGETVRVAGHCTASGAPLASIGGALTLEGGYTLTNWTARTAQTVLDGGGTQQVIVIDTPERVVVDGFVVRGGQAADGPALQVLNAGDVHLRNVALTANTATAVDGAIVAVAGGAAALYNNTFVYNDAADVIKVAGAAVVSNTIIVSNTSDTVQGAGCAFCLVGGDPMFVDPAAGDFHLQPASPAIFAGDPNTDLDHDWEGDPRPLGAGYDIGADECASFPGLAFAPSGLVSLDGAPGWPTIHTHYLTNTGGIADTYELTHSIVYSGGSGWAVSYDRFVSLDSGETAPVPVGVQVPPDAISGSVATVYVTATSGLNPLMSRLVTNTTYINWRPGVTLTPVYSAFLNPGQVITYLHTLRNVGNAPDSFTLTLSSLPGGWAGITPTTVSNLAPGASATIWMSVTVPGTMPGGVTETIAIEAVNWDLDVRAVITDRLQVNHVTGDRFVDGSGNDHLNNCLVMAQPCRSVGYAAGQAAAGDTVRVAAGIYQEHDLLLNKTITIAGGWSTRREDESWWGHPILRPDPERNVTAIDAQDLGRVLEIVGDPRVEGLTLRGGATPGSGGGVFIGSGSPLLRDLRVLDNQATAYGGGIYNWIGTPTIERCWIGGNTAARGAGFATESGAPRFWNNVVFENATTGTAGDGGGIYVLGGVPLIWHDTLYGNSANRGGGIFVSDGSVAISNTIVVSNVAATSGGGVYNVPSATRVGYNDVWGNVNGDYVGTGAGLGSVAVDPGFLAVAGDDYHLAPNSPVADIAAPSVLSTDLDGEARVFGAGPDIGADEFAWGVIHFTPSYSGMVSSCDSIAYTHWVSHTGHYTDTILFDLQSDRGLIVTVDPPQVTLGYRVSVPVTVEVTVPWCPSLGPVKDTTLVTAYSSAHNLIRTTVTDTNYIDVEPALRFTPDRTLYTPPGTVYYTHTLTNLGNYTDTITYTVRGDFGWRIDVLEPTVVLGRGQSRVVTVALTIPDATVSGTVHTMHITANSVYSWMVNGVPVSAGVVDTTTVGPRPAVDVQTIPLFGPGLCIDPQSPHPDGNIGTYPYNVRNNGNLTDAIALAAYTGIDHGFPITITESPFFFDEPVTAPVVFEPNSLVPFFVHVEVPPTTPYGIEDRVYMSATSQFDPSVWDAEAYNLLTIQMDVALDEAVTQTLFLEPQTSYQHTFTYSETFVGPEENRVTLSICDWSASLPARWTPPSPAPIDIVEGEIGVVPVTIGVPMDVYTAVAEICLELETLEHCDARDFVVDTIIVNRPRGELAPDRLNEEAIPGTVMTYSFSLSNPSAFDDQFALSWLFTRPATYPGWTVSVSPATALLDAGQGLTVTAVMTVPPGVQMDEQARLVITATSSYTDAIFDTATTRWTVPSLPMAEIVPDHQGTAYPGTWISYTHVLRNVGNRSGLFRLTTSSSLGFATVEPGMVELSPLESYSPVVVWVFIPAWAEVGAVDDTQVIVTFDKDREGREQMQVVAHDLTTIQPVAGTRYVRPDGVDEGNNCTDPSYGPCATIQHAVAQAAPGDEIRIAGGRYTDLHGFVDGGETVTQVVYLDKSVILRGGYTGPDWDVSDPVRDPSVLDARGAGRAIYVAEDVTATIAGLHLTGGFIRDGHGAGLYIASGAVPTVELNLIEGNEAAGIGAQGGGVYYGGPGSLVLRQNTLRDNRAEDGGGAYLIGVDASVWNNAFDTNVATGLGGGLYALGGSPTVWNNTFYGNSADRGGGLYYLGTGAPAISNTILAWNEATVADGGGGVYVAGGTPMLDYNDYWLNTNGDAPGLVTGTHSLAVDPVFVDPAAGDLHLRVTSPCVDRADPNTTLDRDRDNKPRPLLDGYDIGAYEYGLLFAKQAPAYIVAGGTIQYRIAITNTGMMTQYNVLVTDTLDPALEFVGPLVPPGGEYIAASRTVSWTIDVPAGTIELAFTARVADDLPSGALITDVAWIDSRPSNMVTSEHRTCWVRLNDDPTDYTTVQAAVDASTSPDDVVKVAGTCVGVNTYGDLRQVVYLDKTLTLRGGYTIADWTAPDPAANPTRIDALGLGRVLYVTGDVGPQIEGLILSGGDATGLGGVAGSDAGGDVYVLAATVGLSGSIVSGGQAVLGGGLCALSGAVHMTNTVVSDNQAVSGGGLYLAASTADLLHATLARNDGGGMFLAGYDVVGSTAAMTNVIMAAQSPDLAVDAAGAATVDGVLWWPERDVVGAGTATTANEYIGDPAFAADGYHLSAGSAAVDRGTDTGLPIDIDGHPRPWNDLPDLGADELVLRMDVVKVASPDPVRPGAPLAYTISVTNTGGVALNLSITDTLPAQVEADPAQPLVWSALLEPGAGWTQSVPVTVAVGYSGTLVNQVDVSAAEGLTATYVLTTYAVGTPQVDVFKTVTPAGVQAGEQVTYTIYVANTGDVDLLPVVVDTPPAQVTPNEEVTWTPPLLPPGETWTATLTVTTPFGYAGSLSNTVRVTTAQGVSDTDTVLSMVGVTPAVTVTKSAAPSPVLAGDPLTYTIHVSNTGNAILNATVTDLLPAQVTEPGTRVWEVILDEANRTWSTTVVVTPNLGYLGTLTNVVAVDTLEGARAAYTLTTQSLAALQVRISKAADPDPAAADEPLTYTLSVTNTGNMTLTAWITDHLPANTTHVTATDMLTWGNVLLAPDEVWTATVPVLVDWGFDGQLVNWVEVDTLEGVSDAYTLTTDVQVAWGVEIGKSAAPSPVLAGDPLTYTLYVTNTGSGPLDAVITDVLPDQVTPGGTETWNVTLGAANRTWSTTLVVTPELGYAGVLTNVVRVDTAQGVSDSYTLTTESLIVPGVAVSKQADPFWVEPGSPLIYTVHVTNTGNMTLTAWITDWLPLQVSPSGEQNWALELSPRQAQTFTVPVTSMGGYIGPLVNVVRVDTAEGVWAVYTETSQSCTPLATLDLVGPARGDPGADMAFTATLTPPTTTMPLTYTWEAEGQATVVHVGEVPSDTVLFNWATPGTYAVTLTVVNGCGSTLQRTLPVAVGFCPTGVSGVTIVGVTRGAVDTPYILSALVEPSDATPPLTYLWSPEPAGGQGTATATYSWPTLGEQTVSVQVSNCGGAASDEHTITIQEGGILYLPLLLGNYRRAPDLEVVAIETNWGAGAAPDEVVVTVRNNGPAAVTSDFWVDLYLDPSRVPSTGELWNDLGSQGKAWLVRAPNLAAGGVLVLRTSQPDDPNNPQDRYSVWPDKLPLGAHWLYAQADSYWRPVGMIAELDEDNNVLGQAYTRAANGGAAEPLPTPPFDRPLDTTPEPVLPPEPRPTPGPRPTSTPLP